MIRKHIGFGGMVMLLVLALGAIGFGYALWSKVLTIEGTVRTGSVNTAFLNAFTDDDDFVDAAAFDSMDTGNCEISVGPDGSPFGNDKDPTDGITSCDPSVTGRDPKAHYNKDVARCDVIIVPDGQDGEPQAGSQRARLAILNGYPSYHCTSWFTIVNNGTIPVHLHHILINGAAVAPCEAGAVTQYDLSGDGQPDIEICLSGVPATGEAQIHPRDEFTFDLDIHVMQTAPQGATLTFNAQACLHQWNEETGNCPENVLDSIIDADGFASPQSGDPGAREVSPGDVLSTFGTVTGARCGIDHFDQDFNLDWSAGDDLHCEGSQCQASDPGPAVHDLGFDCKVLDIDGGLVEDEPVNCDLDFMLADPIGAAPGSVCPSAILKYHDANSNGQYDNGEDIVLDANLNGIFD